MKPVLYACPCLAHIINMTWSLRKKYTSALSTENY